MSESNQQQQVVAPLKTYPIQCILEFGQKLYLNSRTADVHFTFGSSQDEKIEKSRLPAHKNLLATASDVFDRMFYGDLRENGDIQMTDVSPAAFKEFLQFFYLSEVKLTEENIDGVMDLGHKYNFTKCVEVCEQFLMDTLTVDNIFFVLNLAILYHRSELMNFCDKFIIVNTFEILDSSDFLTCDRSILARILKLNLLSCSELKLFEACMAWVKAKCDQEILTKELVDEHLGDLFYEIRFASMTTEELWILMAKYYLILQRDSETILKIIKRPSGFQSEKFNQRPRQPHWNGNTVVICDRVIADAEVMPILMNRAWGTLFSASEPLLLGNFTFAKTSIGFNTQNLRNMNWNLSIDARIYERSGLAHGNAELSISWEVQLSSENTVVSLPRPILIRPGFFYQIYFNKIPDGFFAYCNTCREEVQLDPNTIITFYDKQNNENILSPLMSLEFNRSINFTL